jgi:mono/diheme cytochrome c family protein
VVSSPLGGDATIPKKIFFWRAFGWPALVMLASAAFAHPAAAADPESGEEVLARLCADCHAQGGIPGRRGAGVINGVSGFSQISKITARTGSLIDTLIQYRHLPVRGMALSADDMADLTAYLETVRL